MSEPEPPSPRNPSSGGGWLLATGELVLGSLLLALAAAWAWWRSMPLGDALEPSLAGVALGAAACIPAFAAVLLVVRPASRSLPLVGGLQDTLGAIRNVLGPLSWTQIIIISAMAGLSEEVLFRGVVQGELGIVAASVLFGLCHPMGAGYVVYAGLLGLYLGCIAKLSGGLAAPIVTHALYDVAGLWYLTRRWEPPR